MGYVTMCSGFFTLSDGRSSKVVESISKRNLRRILRRQVMDAFRVESSRYAEVFIMNRYFYLDDHYVLDRMGQRRSLQFKMEDGE